MWIKAPKSKFDMNYKYPIQMPVEVWMTEQGFVHTSAYDGDEFRRVIQISMNWVIYLDLKQTRYGWLATISDLDHVYAKKRFSDLKDACNWLNNYKPVEDRG